MNMFRLVALAVALSIPTIAPAQQRGVEQWADEIATFEAADQSDSYAPGGTVFVGSSSIRFWDSLAEDFPYLNPLNRGFGGSRISDVRYYLDELVLKHRPELVVVYAGENDIAFGGDAEALFDDYKAIVEEVREELPETRLVFVSVKPGPARWDRVDEVRKANALVMEYAARDPLLDYVDVFMPMLDSHGQPRGELFVADGIHMNPLGYELWTELIDPYVRAYAH